MNIRYLFYFVDYLVLSNLMTIYVALIQYLLIHRIDYIPLFTGLIVPVVVFKERISKIIGIIHPKMKYSGIRFLIFLVISTLYISLLLLYLYISPVFPLNTSVDFLVYSQGALDIYKGSYGSILDTNDLAVYLPIASLYGLLNQFFNILFVGRLYILFLNILAFLEIYTLALEFYEGYLSEFTLLLFSLFNTFWFITYPATGLYANMLGIVFTLYLLLYSIKYYENKNPRLLILIFIVSAVAILSHTSTLLFISSLLLAGIYAIIVKRNYNLVKAFTASAIPATLLLITLPKAFGNIYEFIFKYGINLKPVEGWAANARFKLEIHEPVKDFLGRISPFLKEAYVQNGYIGVLILCISLILGIYLLIRKQHPKYIILFTWIITIWLATIFLDDEWRFYPYANYSLIILISSLYYYSEKIKKYIEHFTPNKRLNKILKNYVVITLLLILIISSPNILGYINGLRSTKLHIIQTETLRGMEWIKYNTPPSSYVISIVKPEYMFFPLLAERKYCGDVYMTPSQLIAYINELELTNFPVYIVIWNKVKDKNGINLLIYYYDADSRFIKVYSDMLVSIYLYKKLK